MSKNMDLDDQLEKAVKSLDPLAVMAALRLGANPNAHASSTALFQVFDPLANSFYFGSEKAMSADERKLRLEIAEILQEAGGRYELFSPRSMQPAPQSVNTLYEALPFLTSSND